MTSAFSGTPCRKIGFTIAGLAVTLLVVGGGCPSPEEKAARFREDYLAEFREEQAEIETKRLEVILERIGERGYATKANCDALRELDRNLFETKICAAYH